MTPSAFIAVDWGTSSLRVWLMTGNGAVMAEARAPAGMNLVAPGDFEAVLRARLAELGPAVDRVPRPLPVVLCGMVGARQGWCEAPYGTVPAAPAAIVARAVTVAAEGLDCRILPGLAVADRERPDVMRGEETQLIGLLAAEPAATGLVCMPGTHCKWVRLHDGAVSGFSTAMTGELFALIGRQSILRHALAGADAGGDPDSPAFRAGLAAGLAAPAALSTSLFAIRAESLLFGTDGAAAADRLSGLLIGAEIAAALSVHREAGPVRLVASGALARLYGAALAAAGRPVRPVDADTAVRVGLLHAARHFWPALIGSTS